ncbi:hypothetical protein HYH03_004139 [Edaphochlamys debaryana]|uniref:Cystathionine beta-lyase n=1 Tax=Edaphochlamys debaryana TaxID=47281 RepID=A0A835YAT0_9CHLO|nr:hypothetical protein HYH03_004139 [Edaphochlamys debaryana]|eukprot:KAG2497873.1 hypothetical protein HYH03_004139 [Edaphochlamys debaryana]
MDPADLLVAGKREFGEFGGVNASVEISTTFTVLEADTMPAIFSGQAGPEKGGCYVYGRAFNPTVRHLGRLLAAMEATEAAYPCSSGMAAISSTILALCNAGDHVVASNSIYGGSHALFKSLLPVKCNISTTFVDISDLAAVEAALQARPTKVLYTEVVSNPILRVADLSALSALARRHGAKLVVDNTFTPMVVTPTKFGADIVIHSLTKFVSGASDIIAGAVCGPAAFIDSLIDFHTGPVMLLGPTMDPRVASELTLRLPHLALRMQEHGRRAAAFAERLAALGAPVTYPGLTTHPQHALMAKQANAGYGFGGLLGVDLGTPGRANALMERLQNKWGFGFMAVSLGYFDTLMSLSAASTSSELSDREMSESGIARGYVRMSVGLTGSLEERWRQLEEAYRAVSKLGPGAEAPFRAVKMRLTPEGAPEQQLLSWPSLGSFGSGEEAAAGGTAAAAGKAAAAGATEGFHAALAEVLQAQSGPSGASEPAVEAVAMVEPGDWVGAEAAAGGATKRRREGEGLEEDGDVTSPGGLRVAVPAAEERPASSGGGGSARGVARSASWRRGGLEEGTDGRGMKASGSVKIRRTGSSEIHYVLMQQHEAAGEV